MRFKSEFGEREMQFTFQTETVVELELLSSFVVFCSILKCNCIGPILFLY